MSERLRVPATTKHLEMIHAMVKGDVPHPPIASLIGFTITRADLGLAVMEMDVERRHANPMGTLHGGVICDLADAAMGTAFASLLEDDESFTTLDLTVKFFKPLWDAHLVAEARVTRQTRTMGLVECDVVDGKGSLVAKVWSSCTVLRGGDAKGR